MTRLTSGHLLSRNTLWNLIGQGAPLLVAAIAIPHLVKGLGIDRFGILTLAWMGIGYFSLFDLGLGRAVTKLVAEKLGHDQPEEVPTIVWTAVALLLGLGTLGGLTAAILVPWIVRGFLHIPAGLQAESLSSFYLLASSLPIVICTAVLRGVLEAWQRFGLLNLIRVPMGLFTYLGPLCVLPYSHQLGAVVLVLVVGRWLGLLAHLFPVWRLVPINRGAIAMRRTVLAPLFFFGGWVTVTNLISPLMATMDRFLIGDLAAVRLVSYYATPYELASKLPTFANASVGVLFPAFSATIASDAERARLLFDRGLKLIFLAVFPCALVVVTFAQLGLGWWLGPLFATNSTFVLQVLAMGMLVSSLAQIPFALVQSTGRPDLSAKLLLVEFIPYAAILVWSIRHFGLTGAAIVWAVRIVIETIAICWIAGRFLPASRMPRKTIAMLLLLSSAGLALGMAPLALIPKSLGLLFSLLAFACIAWLTLFEATERRFLMGLLPQRSRQATSHESVTP